MVGYLAIVLLGFAAWLLFQARGIFGAVLSHARVKVGDYDGALRRARSFSLGVPNAASLHREGLILTLAGRAAEAEQRYRKALGMLRSDSRYPRERLHASLGSALLDLGRYGEAERCFHDAIEAGDVTGNSQDGLAELRVVQGQEAEAALDYSRQAIERARRREGRPVPGPYHANQAWALALLGRSEEARAPLAEAVRDQLSLPSGIAGLHWRAGMALLAMNQPAEARQHFQIGRDADPRGKYGRRCAEQLRSGPTQDAAPQ
jgi:tetratricopeptide (TPR) repeat protein